MMGASRPIDVLRRATPLGHIQPWQWQMLPPTAREARAKGERRYFTGKPCNRGHYAYRIVTDNSCALCAAEARMAQPDSAREALRAASRAWRSKNIEAQRARERARHAIDRQASRARSLAYQKANPEKVCASVKARDRRLRQATPKWADLAAIKAFYLACPRGWHVDHIVPVKGRTVCGLHVLNNLQYLTATENRQKGNRFHAE